MSTIDSVVPAIRNLRFENSLMPTKRTVKVKAFTSLSKSGPLVILGEDGVIYTTRIHSHVYYPAGYDHGALIPALYRLKVVTASDARRHTEHVKSCQAQCSRNSHKNALMNSLAKVGVKLTKRQEKQVCRYVTNS